MQCLPGVVRSGCLQPGRAVHPGGPSGTRLGAVVPDVHRSEAVSPGVQCLIGIVNIYMLVDMIIYFLYFFINTFCFYVSVL